MLKIENSINMNKSNARYEIAKVSGSVNTERFTYEEIVFLLDLCEKHCIVSQSQSKGYNLIRAFTPIHDELLQAGYNRSLTQVIDKFRKLKLRFAHSYLARKRGKLAMANRFEHYKRFEKILENAKVDVDTFIKKFPRKDYSQSNDNSFSYAEIKDESNSRNPFDYENIEAFDEVTMEGEEVDIIEKEVLLDDEYQNDDDTEDYSTENSNIKILPHLQPSTSSSCTNRNKDISNMTLTERTVLLLEELVPNFKKAQEELQTQFFKQQKELLRQHQEWEERILDEEREYFTKVLSNLNNFSNQ